MEHRRPDKPAPPCERNLTRPATAAVGTDTRFRLAAPSSSPYSSPRLRRPDRAPTSTAVPIVISVLLAADGLGRRHLGSSCGRGDPGRRPRRDLSAPTVPIARSSRLVARPRWRSRSSSRRGRSPPESASRQPLRETGRAAGGFGFRAHQDQGLCGGGSRRSISGTSPSPRVLSFRPERARDIPCRTHERNPENSCRFSLSAKEPPREHRTKTPAREQFSARDSSPVAGGRPSLVPLRCYPGRLPDSAEPDSGYLRFARRNLSMPTDTTFRGHVYDDITQTFGNTPLIAKLRSASSAGARRPRSSAKWRTSTPSGR